MDVAESDKFGSGDSGDCEDKTVKKSPYSKNLNKAMDYLTPDTRQVFTQLRQAFTKALILRHFNPQCQIRYNALVTGSIIMWLTLQLLIYASIKPFKLKSPMCLTEPLPNKQCCLIASS